MYNYATAKVIPPPPRRGAGVVIAIYIERVLIYGVFKQGFLSSSFSNSGCCLLAWVNNA